MVTDNQGATGFDDITVTVKAASPISENLSEIPLDVKRFYQLNNFANNLAGLIDGNTSDPVIPGYGQILSPYEVWYEFPDQMKVLLKKFRFYDGQGDFAQTPLKIYGIMRTPAGTWDRVLLATFNGTTYMNWVEAALDSAVPIKYMILQVYSQGGGHSLPTELELWGSYNSYTEPPLATVSRKKFENYLGVNTYEWNLLQNNITPAKSSEPYGPKWEILKPFHQYRHYLDWKNVEYKEGEYAFESTQDGNWNLDTFYARLSSEGRVVLPDIKGLPPFLQATYPADQLDHENVPVPFGADFSSPASYIAYARMMFQFSARYGSTRVDPSLLSVTTPAGHSTTEVKKSGLGYIHYVEIENERDKWWKGRKAYQTGREYAAYLSATYDGHLGTLGPKVGIKTADPTMKVVIGGTAQPDVDFHRGIIDWCKEFRNDSLPFDAYNYHFYSNDAATSQGNSDQTRGIAPELSKLGEKADLFNEFTQRFGKNKEVWITETGYDVDQSSEQKAIAIGNRTVLQTQADWLIRTALKVSEKRQDRLFFYELYDNMPGVPGIFLSSGFAEQDLQKRPSLNYIEQIGKVLGKYEFEQVISINPAVHKYVNGSSVRYVAWMPTENGSTSFYSYPVTNASGHLKVFNFVDEQSDMNQEYIPVANGVATLSLTETPIIFEETDSVKTFSPPTANAGSDQVLNLPENKTILAGTGSDVDGTISYQWSKISGDSSTIVSNYSPQTEILSLKEGIYFFELKVTDNDGKLAKDTVKVTVIAEAQHSKFSDAGADHVITIPKDSSTMAYVEAIVNTAPGQSIAS
jgi:hypothetical protein